MSQSQPVTIEKKKIGEEDWGRRLGKQMEGRRQSAGGGVAVTVTVTVTVGGAANVFKTKIRSEKYQDFRLQTVWVEDRSALYINRCRTTLSTNVE